MKRNIIHKLTATMMIAAGILIGVPEDLFAQSQSQSKSSSQSTQSHSKHGANHNMAKGGKQSMSNNPSDANFVKKASESNLAEIKLSELALEKSSSDKVREYAQMMIKHHTAAQTELASIVSNYTSSNPAGNSDTDANDADKMSTLGGTGGTTGNAQAEGMTNGQYNSNRSSRDKSGADNSRNPSGSTTATGSTYSSGNANGAAGTTGNQEGRSSDGAASQNTPSNGNNNVNTNTQSDANNNENESDATGGAGANSGGTTSSMSSGRISHSTPETDGNSQDMNNSSASTNNMGNATVSSTMKYDLPNELSPEHKALRDKLAKLSGAEFDKQYMQAMLKDHTKAVELFEKQASVSNDSGDSQLKAYASKNLPLIKEHYEKAKAWSGSSSMNSDAKNKGSK